MILVINDGNTVFTRIRVEQNKLGQSNDQNFYIKTTRVVLQQLTVF